MSDSTLKSAAEVITDKTPDKVIETTEWLLESGDKVLQAARKQVVTAKKAILPRRTPWWQKSKYIVPIAGLLAIIGMAADIKKNSGGV